MKKRMKIILLVGILLIILVAISVFLYFRHTSIYSEYKGSLDLSVIERNLENKEYYEFEDNGKKYIMFKVIEGVYAPSNLTIISADITESSYSNNTLYLTIDIETYIEEIEATPDLIIDGFNSDSKLFTMEVEDNFNGLVINNESYSLISNKIIRKNTSEETKYGYIGENGEITIPLEYDNLYEIDVKEVYDDDINDYIEADFSNYLRCVKDDKQGIIDKQGNVIISIDYDQIKPYSKDAFAVTIENNSKIGIVDTNNQLIKGFVEGGMYDDIIFGEYYVFSKRVDGEFIGKGILDRDLNVVLEPIYDDFYYNNFTTYNNDGTMNQKYFGGENGITFSRDYVVVEKGDQTAILDSDYNFITEFKDLSVYDIKIEYENELEEMLNTMD